MSWSFSLGRLFGSELRVHLTFFLLLAWVGYAAWAQGGPQSAFWNVMFVVALFACVVAHEFGHALTARRYGIRTPDITLLPIGGLARLERMPEKPAQEIIVALAGPAVNLVIAAVLVLVFGIVPDATAFDPAGMTARDFLGALAMVNILLAVFNMIPAFPMDGGRIFRAVVTIWTDRVRATRIAAAAGQIVAVLFGFIGLSGGNPILVLIAFFIFIAANAESQDVALHAIARRLRARDAMITRYEPLLPEDTVSAAAAALIRSTQHEFPVLGREGELHGFVTRNAIFEAMMAEGGGTRPVTEILEPDIPRVPLADSLETVLDALGQGAPAVAITNAQGQMVGYVTRENIGELMVLRDR